MSRLTAGVVILSYELVQSVSAARRWHGESGCLDSMVPKCTLPRLLYLALRNGEVFAA